jgi:single-strand DNA-binding protein
MGSIHSQRRENMYHRIVIVGNLGRDPELRYMPDGTPVTTLSVATSDQWVDKNSGERRERTIWWRVSVWRKQAEHCNQYLSKGRQVLIEGTMNPDATTGGPRIWTDQNGQARASYEVTAQTVRFLGGKGGAAPAEGSAPAAGEAPGGEEDLPF